MKLRLLTDPAFFVREGPVINVVRDQSSAIFHKDHFDVTVR